MQVDVLEIHGLWDCGFVLDRHSTHPTLTGHDAHGHPTFDTDYTEVGRALYALKSHDDYSQVPRLAKTLHTHVIPPFTNNPLRRTDGPQQEEAAPAGQPCGGLSCQDAERACS